MITEDYVSFETAKLLKDILYSMLSTKKSKANPEDVIRAFK